MTSKAHCLNMAAMCFEDAQRWARLSTPTALWIARHQEQRSWFWLFRWAGMPMED